MTGLPTQWTPGQTYALTLLIGRPGAVKFGFEASVVVDLTNAQAGTLTPGSNRVQVVTAGGIQFAEQTAVAVTTGPFDGIFSFVWTAPSDPGIGNVRFDIAACAANGDGAASGDYVYTQQVIIPALDVPAGTASVDYTIADHGMFTSRTIMGGGVNAGSARIIAANGTSTPSGVAIFGLTTNGILTSEAGVPASPLLRVGRINAEVNGPLDTGIAIANPGTQAATINFYFTRTDGTDTGSGSTTIPPGGQIARFLDQAPFNSGASFQGTFSFSSNVPVGVIALRGLTNERSEFLMTTLPVVDTSLPAASAPILLPHFADGGGWTTTVILVNPGDSTLAGVIQFKDATGLAGASVNYSIPRRTSFRYATAGISAATQTGSVLVTPAAGSAAPVAFNVFSYKPGPVTVSEAGIVPVSGSALRIYVALSGKTPDPGAIDSGVAIANPSASAVTLTLELFQANGLSTGLVGTLKIPAFGQTAKFLSELFPSLTPPFEGIVRVTAGSVGISAIGLRGRYNERSEFLFTTTPPANENNSASAAEFDFAHIVAGGGFTTQFVLFSGSAGQSGTGSIRFFAQDGTSLLLPLSE